VAESCVEHLALVVSSCHPKARILLRLDFAHDALQRNTDRLQSATTGRSCLSANASRDQRVRTYRLRS
jgi:hypothetical protein